MQATGCRQCKRIDGWRHIGRAHDWLFGAATVHVADRVGVGHARFPTYKSQLCDLAGEKTQRKENECFCIEAGSRRTSASNECSRIFFRVGLGRPLGRRPIAKSKTWSRPPSIGDLSNFPTLAHPSIGGFPPKSKKICRFCRLFLPPPTLMGAKTPSCARYRPLRAWSRSAIRSGFLAAQPRWRIDVRVS